MSFIYPRLIQISRVKPDTGVGAISYGAQKPDMETVIFRQIPASIQLGGTGKSPAAGVPSDSAGRSNWKILLAPGLIDNGLIKNRDKVTDDLGDRYAVTAAYWNSMGYKLLCEKLEL